MAEILHQLRLIDYPIIYKVLVEVDSLSQYLQGFSTIPGGFLAGFQPQSVLYALGPARLYS